MISIDPHCPLSALPALGAFPDDYMGIKADADPSNYGAKDRVFPVRPECTVLTAYNQLPVLERILDKKGKVNYLEIGCGQGFASIAAAKCLQNQHKSQDSGIYLCDSNPRALRFAKTNAEQNHVDVLTTPAQNFSSNLRIGRRTNLKKHSIDVMYLNPPFLQKFPLLEPHTPIFAAAGNTDGMDVFNQWVQQLPPLLAPGGVVLGTTMTPVTESGEISALETLSHNLGKDSSVEYFHIVPPIETRRFLELQYQPVIDAVQANKDTVLADNIRQWIDDNSKRYPKLAYVFFEATNQGGQSVIKPMERPHWNNHGIESMEQLATSSKTLLTAYHTMLATHQRNAVSERILSVTNTNLPAQ